MGDAAFAHGRMEADAADGFAAPAEGESPERRFPPGSYLEASTVATPAMPSAAEVFWLRSYSRPPT
jgi:hypothetical protein